MGTYKMSRDGTVIIVTKLQAVWFEVRILWKTRDLPVVQNIQTNTRSHSASMGIAESFPGIKW